MIRLKFEIFVESEPRNKFEALELIKYALKYYLCPEEFVQWESKEEND